MDVAELRIQPLPKRMLIHWPAPPRLVRMIRTVDLPRAQTGEPLLRCGEFDAVASTALQRLEQAAADQSLAFGFHRNVVTGRRSLLASEVYPWQGEPLPLAELLFPVSRADSEEASQFRAEFGARARRRGIALIIHVPREGRRDGALAFVTDYEVGWKAGTHYLARLFVRESDAAQWERPQA